MNADATTGFRLGTITAAGAEIPFVERGPADSAIRLLIIPPLFEEMNRCRQAMAGISRLLASHNIASLLPDLPGTGDSALPLEAISWQDWQLSLIALAQQWRATHALAIRGASLLTESLELPAFHLAPIVSGERIWRDLLRARIIADQEAGHTTARAQIDEAVTRGETVTLAGYDLPAPLARALLGARVAQPANDVTLRPDDPSFAGPPVWLQAEPLPATLLSEAVVNWLLPKLAG